MSDGYACPFGCKAKFGTFAAARDHTRACPSRKRRLEGLGLDLVIQVDRRELTLEAAEKIQAARPRLKLD